MNMFVLNKKAVEADVDFVVFEKVGHYNEDNGTDYCEEDFAVAVDYNEILVAYAVAMQGYCKKHYDIEASFEPVEDGYVLKADVDVPFAKVKEYVYEENMFLILYEHINLEVVQK